MGVTSSRHAEAFTTWLCNLDLEIDLPAGFLVMNPYADSEVQRVVRCFYSRYLSGSQSRLSIWGINPGRFGAGITGLAFTDPWALNHQLNIPTSLDGRREPSAIFISAVIDAYGGAQAFYDDVLLTAFSPLGFVRSGVNVNFYDDAALQRAIVPFVAEHVDAVREAGAPSDSILILGSGKLRQFVERHLAPTRRFNHVVALDHPRYIMQYRRATMDRYVEQYVDTIRQHVGRMRQQTMAQNLA